ncbi:MAG: hypothetical protein NUW37_12660 [Planctomycetes bacterium]|nr:hypothetical protein [Planctomycetota bacterium]
MRVRIAIIAFILPAIASAMAGAMEITVEREFQAEIDRAIKFGAQYVAGTQRSEDGGFPFFGGGSNWEEGAAALATLVMVKSREYAPGSDRVRKAFEFIRKKMTEHFNSDKGLATYSVAFTMMAIEACNVENSAHQGRPGSSDAWFAPGDREWMKDMAEWLAKNISGENIWGYPDKTPDLSNTQVALLGLASAHRCKVDVDDPSIYRKVLDRLLEAQQRDGEVIPRELVIYDRDEVQARGPRETISSGGISWGDTNGNFGDRARGFGYRPVEQGAYGSMTCGGIVSLVLCKGILTGMGEEIEGELSRKIDQSIYDGLAWLRKHYVLDKNPSDTGAEIGWHYYYLYSLERVGVLVGTEFIGRHMWYREGARYLVDAQVKDRGDNLGSWLAPTNAQAGQTSESLYRFGDTCFAVLFLKRSTMPLRAVITPPPERPTTPRPAPPPERPTTGG